MFKFKVDRGLTNEMFKTYPKRQRKLIGDAIRKTTLEGVAKARVFAPSGETGGLRRGIHAKFEIRPFSFVGSVEAASPSAEDQIKAGSIEFGRSYSRASRWPSRTGKRFTGYTQPRPFIRQTWLLLGKKNMARIRRAINKAAKEVGFR